MTPQIGSHPSADWKWRDLVTARPEECDPIDDPRLRYDRFTARVLIVCALAMGVSGYLTGAGSIDFARFLFTTPNLTDIPSEEASS